ncbi:MAG TPA: DUF1385 domain-containing protein [Solirubrobacteraceae bacterium]|nr:DUF1385 domain-containing protein [Solirubrobacteraceae bacterium]
MTDAAQHESERHAKVAAGGLEPVTARDAPLGGQAVLEGVMMRGVSTWAVATRLPAAEQIADGRRMPSDEAARGEIRVRSFPLVSVLKRHRWLRWPLVRGVVALGESLKIGFDALNISANAQLPDGEQELSGGAWIGTVVFALSLAVGLFFLVPVGITSLFRASLPNALVFVLVEKLIRIAIFLAYLTIVSRLHHLQRVFEYHGAEHKTISCYEAGLPLTPNNAQRFSRLHPRCGTSFLLIVMIVSTFVFAPLGTPAWYWLFASRVLGIPVVAGLAFEVIKWFGRNHAKRWARALMLPGMKLQLLTTREPDLDQLAVAIAALEAVLAVEVPGQASDEELIGIEVVA